MHEWPRISAVWSYFQATTRLGRNQLVKLGRKGYGGGGGCLTGLDLFPTRGTGWKMRFLAAATKAGKSTHGWQIASHMVRAAKPSSAFPFSTSPTVPCSWGKFRREGVLHTEGGIGGESSAFWHDPADWLICLATVVNQAGGNALVK